MNDVLPPCPVCGNFHHPPTSVCSCSCCHKLHLKISPVYAACYTGQIEPDKKPKTAWSVTDKEMETHDVVLQTTGLHPFCWWTELKSNGKTIRWDCNWPAKFVLTPKCYTPPTVQIAST